MKRFIFAVFAALAPSLLPAGGAADFARGSNIYSLRIFNLAVSQNLAKPAENLALAPAPIQNQGAAFYFAGENPQIRAAFCLPENPRECLEFFEKFGGGINFRRDGALSMSPAIFTKRFLPLKPDFAKTAKAFSLGLDSFNPELPEVAALKIGQWLDWISFSRHKDVFLPSFVPADANVFWLSSAVFDFSRVQADFSAPLKFTFNSGKAVEKQAAVFSAGTAAGEFSGFDAAILNPPNCEFSIVFFKPKNSERAKNFLSTLDAETFENSFKVLKLLAGEKGSGTQIAVPRFQISSGLVNLNSAVSASGAQAVFGENLYPKFSSEKLKVGNVLQACSLSLMCGAPLAANQISAKTFALDRPFAVAVADYNSGRIIMLAAVENPKKR